MTAFMQACTQQQQSRMARHSSDSRVPRLHMLVCVQLVSGRSSPEPSKQRSFVAEPYGSDQNLMIQGIRQASPGLVI